MKDETPNTGQAQSGSTLTDEQRLQWRMDLITRFAERTGTPLEAAAKQFKKAEALVAKG